MTPLQMARKYRPDLPWEDGDREAFVAHPSGYPRIVVERDYESKWCVRLYESKGAYRSCGWRPLRVQFGVLDSILGVMEREAQATLWFVDSVRGAKP